MRPKYFLPAVLVILLFPGCYTQLLTENDEPWADEPQTLPDTETYCYFPQNHLDPIPGWNPPVQYTAQVVPSAPDTTLTTEVVASPTDDQEQWPAIFYYAVISPLGLSTQPIGPDGEKTSAIFPVTKQQDNSSPTASSLPPSPSVPDVRRTSGYQRVGEAAPGTSSDDTMRKSGTTRRDGR